MEGEEPNLPADGSMDGWIRSSPWHVDAENNWPVVGWKCRIRKLHKLCVKALCHRIAGIPDDPLGFSGLSYDEDALKPCRLPNTWCIDTLARTTRMPTTFHRLVRIE